MLETKNKLKFLNKWFSTLLKQTGFQVESIPLSSSKEWFFSNGSIKHKSNRFFNVVGVSWEDPSGNVIKQPMIEQREVGTLGFLIHKKKILIQAKVEPGNMGIFQLAPTCQATASNSDRVHGGDKPPFSSLFISKKEYIVHESLQSEHGSRFLGKLNRNILSISKTPVRTSRIHKWVLIDDFLKLLHHDYTINTDARSVIVCSPWDVLVDRPLFSRYSSNFANDLAVSANCKINKRDINITHGKLNKIISKIKPPKIINLNKLDNWEITDEGIKPKKGNNFTIRQIRVTAQGREVPEWDQPIVDSSTKSEANLICGRIGGILHFLFKPQVEAGLHNYVELGPTESFEIGGINKSDYVSGAMVVAECWQSDEGGRFYKDISHYQIIDVGKAYKTSKDCRWLNLAQIQKLLVSGGFFTNEARSALSLLLYWL